MPITLPNLDDRTYADLVEEARALIPAYASGWTNFNASDPGMTLVELFAYVSEMLLYRLNRVPEANVRAFLKLLNEPGWEPPAGEPLSESVAATVRRLREPYRAVTREDFEYLTLKAAADYQRLLKSERRQVAASLGAFEVPLAATLDGLSHLSAGAWEVRARCVPERNLEAADAAGREEASPGHISVVLATDQPAAASSGERGLVRFVRDYLEERRLVTTHVHVVEPHAFRLGLRFTLVLAPDALTLHAARDVRAPAEKALRRLLDPFRGGPEGAGWPFGRSVYVSELYELLDGQRGVDYVTQTKDARTSRPLDELTVPAGEEWRLTRNASGEVVAAALRVDEFIAPVITLEVVDPQTT
jgi:hypothetical protein